MKDIRTCINTNFSKQNLFKYIFLSVMFLTLGLPAKAQTVYITPDGNPASVVIMGDSLTFSTTLLSSAAVNNAELEVEVPAGFELLTSTPDFKSGSLSVDKRKGRILIASLPVAPGSLSVTVYVKALCNAETATQLADRKITYSFFLSASAATSLSTVTIPNGIQNFNNPTLNILYPASDVVSLNSVQTRTFTVIQTRNSSHVNNMQIVAQCDNSGFDITKVEVRRNDSQAWTEIAVEKPSNGYRYLIKRDEVFTPANGYPNRQLGYNDTLLIRETVKLIQCDKGSLNYSISYGDGVSFCSSASNGNVTYSQPNYVYTPDIFHVALVSPGGPAIDGRFVSGISNNSMQAEAIMHDLYVNCESASAYIFKSAYLTDASGNPITNGTDTIFLNLKRLSASNYQVHFDNLNNPALYTVYSAQGLSDLDGDGIYNDLPKGNTVYFAIKTNYLISTGSCPSTLIDETTRIFRIYYKTFCKGNTYQNYVRNYYPGEGNGSTNTWQGYIRFGSMQNVAVSPVVLQTNDPARISGNLYYNGNGSVTSVIGNALFNTVVSGVSRYFSIIILPKGLSFDNTQSNPVRIGNTNLTPGTHYTVSPTLDTVRIQWKANWGANNYRFNIAVKNNGTADDTKTIQIYHEYDYGNTGVLQKFSCVSSLVSYTQVLPCSYLGIDSLNIERRSFGYTDITKATRVTDPNVARSLGFNMKIISPYDDVDVEGRFKAGTSISTGGGNQIRIEFSYVGSTLFNPVSGSPNGISLYYHNNPVPIQIPSSAMTSTTVSGSRLIRFDIAPYLSGAGINTLNINDSLKVIMHLRATTSIPTSGTDLYVQMRAVTVIGGVANECSPLMDNVRIWNSDWESKTNSYLGGSIGDFDHFYTYNTAAFDLTITWSYGQANVWGNEYRPNGDNFSEVVIRFPNLLRINRVTMLVNGIKGNMSTRALNATEYSVTYSNGDTYVNINSGVTRDYMSSSSATGIGYQVNFDMINPTGDNNTGYMPYRYQTYSYQNYPTSAAPTTVSYNNQSGRIYANGGMFNHPYQYALTPLPVNATPTSTRAEWTIRITNQSSFIASNSDLPHSWLAVECPSGVVPVELRDAATNTAVPASFVQYASGAVDKYWIKIGTVAASPDADYVLSCTYSVCTGAPQLTLKYGMSKIDYPTDPDAGYSNYNSPGKLAGVVSTTISYTPPAIRFAGHLFHYTEGANSANEFCDSVMFEGEYSNGLPSSVNGLQLRVPLPSGTSYYTAYIPEVKFGNEAWKNVQSANLNATSDTLLITLDNSKEMLGFGDPAGGDRVRVRYALFIDCGVENGTQFPAEFTGHSGCGTLVTERTADVVPLQISGVSPPPNYLSQNLSLTSGNSFIYTSDAAPTNGAMNLSGKYILAGNADANVIAIIDLPPNLKMTSHAGDLTFSQDGSRLTADLPSSAMTGAVYTISNISLVPEHPEQWTEDIVTVYIRTGKKANKTCNSQLCVMIDELKIDSVRFAFKKLDISFSSAITAFGSYGSSTTEHVVIDGLLVNSGGSSYFNAPALNLDLWYRNGASYTPVPGASGLQATAVNHSGSKAFRITADVPKNINICNMVVVLRKNNTANNSQNPWLSDSISINVPAPVYEITSQPAPICQMAENTPIGENAIDGYSYAWEPAGYLKYLSSSSVTPVNFTYSDYKTNPYPDGATLEYYVTVTRPDGCTSRDTVFVRLKGIPSVQPTADIVRCHGEGLLVNFVDGTGSGTPPTTFAWRITSVTGNISGTGLSSSGNGNISVTSLVNNTKAAIVAKCIATPQKDGCDGVSDTFNITINPVPSVNAVSSQTVCSGGAVSEVTFGTDITSPAVTYSWSASGDWSNITDLSSSGNGNFSGFTAKANTSNASYVATVTVTPKIGTCTGSAKQFTITVLARLTQGAPVIGEDTVCYNTVPGSITGGTVIGGATPYTYQWQDSIDGSAWSDITANGTGVNYQPAALGVTTYYRRIVTSSSSCGNNTSPVLKVTVLPSSILDYPDIRLDVCRGTTVNLSKYVDTTVLESLVWRAVSGMPIVDGRKVVIDGNHNPGTYTFKYEATNRCITPVERVVYLRVLSDKSKVRVLRDTVEICYEKAEAIHVNQIFGIEAGGTFAYAGDGGDITPYIIESKSSSSPYNGAVVVDGKSLYKDASIPYYDKVKQTKRVTITYTPAAGSCLSGRTFKTTIILTPAIE